MHNNPIKANDNHVYLMRHEISNDFRVWISFQTTVYVIIHGIIQKNKSFFCENLFNNLIVKSNQLI